MKQSPGRRLRHNSIHLARFKKLSQRLAEMASAMKKPRHANLPETSLHLRLSRRRILRPGRPAEASQSRSYPGKQAATAAAAAVATGLLLLPSRRSLWRLLPSWVQCCTCRARRRCCGTLLLPGRGMQDGVAGGRAPCAAAAAKSHPPKELGELARAAFSARRCAEWSIAAVSETPARSQPQYNKASTPPFCPRRSSKQRVTQCVHHKAH